MRIRILCLVLLFALPLSAASRRRAVSTDRCSEIVAPASLSFPAAGGHASVAVTVNGGCGWSPVASQSWITSAPATGGISVDVSANTAVTPRTGLIHIRGSVVVVTQAANQNLLNNGNFDTSVAGWSDTFSTGAGSAVWNSGAALVTSTDVRKGYQLAQCVSVTGGKKYEVGTKTMVPAGQGAGITTLAIYVYSVPGCPSPNPGYYASIPSYGGATVGAWFDNAFAFSTDSAAKSVLVVIGAGLSDSPPFRAYFDDVFIREKQ